LSLEPDLLAPVVNLPWHVYGCDFGGNAWQPGGGLAGSGRAAALSDALARLAARGARAVRWFLFCDGRSGLVTDLRGDVRGLDDRVRADLDTALRLLESHRLGVVFVLMDFHWFKPQQVVNGVALGGRRYLIEDPVRRQALVECAFGPVLDALGREPSVLGWDVFNEPEWAVYRLGTPDRTASVPAAAMRSWLAELVQAVQVRARQPATVGLATAGGLPLVRGLGLDFYQWHWYDSVEAAHPLDRPVTAFALDRPVVLGEFPTRGSARTPAAIRAAARQAGYRDAWAWSALAEDPFTDGDACLAALDETGEGPARA
jgi:hypothetical protein